MKILTCRIAASFVLEKDDFTGTTFPWNGFQLKNHDHGSLTEHFISDLESESKPGTEELCSHSCRICPDI